MLLTHEEPNLTIGRRTALLQHLWSGFDCYPDTADFLAGIIFWALRSQGAVTLADMTRPGAPLIFVNDSF